MEDLEQEALYDCVGLEALVSSKVMRFVNEMKQGHARPSDSGDAVLPE